MYYYRINNLCIKFVIVTSLHYDARSEKLQIMPRFEVRNPTPLDVYRFSIRGKLWRQIYV